MVADARLWAPSDAAVKLAFLNFTTSGRLQKVGRRALKILSFDAAPTMHTKQSSASGRCLFARKRPRSIAVLNSVRTEFTPFEQLEAAEIGARGLVAHFGAGAGCANGPAVGNGSGAPRAARVKAAAGARRVEEP
jgi:hypothetical protein